MGNPVRKDLSSVAQRKGRGLHSFLISLWRLYLPFFFCFAAVLVFLFLCFFIHKDPPGLEARVGSMEGWIGPRRKAPLSLEAQVLPNTRLALPNSEIRFPLGW